MSRLIPDTNTGKIAFYRSKNTPWAAAPTSIGTTALAVSALATLVTAAQTKLDAQLALQEATKNATVALHEALKAMSRAGSDIIKQIRTKAAIDGNGVYILAEIPPPATPGPVAAPGLPYKFVVTLNPDGSLLLKWKCPNPAGSSGTSYQVQRRIGATGEFVAIGACGLRSFVDPTVPAGTASVTYKIQGFRTTAVGPAAEFIVNFGAPSAAGGSTFVSVVSAPKLAA